MKSHERWLLIGLGMVLGGVAVVSFKQAAKLDYDFHHFYRDAAYVWQHGQLNPDLDNPDRSQRRQLPFYLPVVALLLSPLTAGGSIPAALVWTLGHLISLAYCFKVLAHWSRSEGSRAPPLAAISIATAVALPVMYETARFNQVSFFVLALVLASVAALEQHKPLRAGVWLGLATVLKLLPAVFGLWLLLKRQWAALAALLVTVLLVTLLPPLLVFGPRDTAQYHRQWWHYNVYGPAARGMVDTSLRSHFLDHRNQSIPAVVGRLCWPEHPRPAALQPLALSEPACQHLAQGLMIALAIALLWQTRRPVPFGWQRHPASASTSTIEPRDLWRWEAAAYLVAMLVFSPLLRTYYLVWALPGLVLLARWALDDRGRRLQRLGQIGIILWVAGKLAWMSDAARSCGVHLIMLIALGGILLQAAKRSSVYSRQKIKQAL